MFLILSLEDLSKIINEFENSTFYKISYISFVFFISELKSFNIIKLDNGQFAAQPNNRVIFTDQSLVHPDRKTPDFKVCSQNYTVENTPKWSVGHTDEWQYKTKDEKEYLIEEQDPNDTDWGEGVVTPDQGC